jgi:hypothetical protein
MMRLNRYFCSLLSACAALSCAWAQSPEETIRTWVVDNNLDNPAADFHVLQEAVDAAAVGDRILVTPSLESYDSITINQGITLIGAGFGNGNYNQGGAQKSSIRRITITAGSSNIVISGLRIFNLSFSGRKSFEGPDTISNVTLYRNEFSPRNTWDNDKSISLNQAQWGSVIKNLNIINNYFHNTIGLREQGSDYFKVSAVIENNYIRGGINSRTSKSASRQNTFHIINNTIWSGSSNAIEIQNGVFKNNIMINESLEISSSENVKVENNVFYGEGGDDFTDNNNIQVDDISSIMVNGGEFAEAWTLVEGSPAIGHGVGGVDAGIMGGRYPWGKAELSMLPYIKDLRAPSVVFKGDQATVEVEIGNPN